MSVVGSVSTGNTAVDLVMLWGGAISLVVGLGTALWRVGRAVSHLFRRASQFFDDWYGEEARPGVRARPGIMVRMEGMEERVSQVWHEVFPNGGGSLRDAVDQANDRLATLCPADVDPCPPPPQPPAPPVVPPQPDPPDEPSGP
ncbi:hypothetical protein ABZ923_37320 [Streptomyces sp. NPDC046881]|uniref:hypothetical protein n=1 Tax=Streptomyces sp. NPDC046881 TaxID=3155374 RepID=UPI0033F59555